MDVEGASIQTSVYTSPSSKPDPEGVSFNTSSKGGRNEPRDLTGMTISGGTGDDVTDVSGVSKHSASAASNFSYHTKRFWHIRRHQDHPEGIDEIGSNHSSGVVDTARKDETSTRTSPRNESRKKCLKIALGVLAVVILALIIFVIVYFTVIEPNNRGGSSSAIPGAGPEERTDAPSPSPVLPAFAWLFHDIIKNGKLKCGISGQRGLSEYDPTTQTHRGFDADLCRAIAAAVFGPDDIENRVDFIPLSGRDRFEALADGKVHLLTRETTHTTERDVNEPTTGLSFSFSGIYLFSGLKIGGRSTSVECAENADNNGTCADTVICVADGTTHVDIIKQFNPEADILPVISGSQLYDPFKNNLCNTIAAEQLNLAEEKVRAAGYVDDDYVIGEKVLSKEPLAIVTRPDDPRWTDFVNTVLQGLLLAEEQGVTHDIAEKIGKIGAFGEAHADMLINAIRVVGNYAEMYKRSIQDLVPRTAADRINVGNSPLLYPLPFGSLEPISGIRAPRGILSQILTRGLRCGLVIREFFAERDDATGEWKGLEVDYCKALAAAVFEGDSKMVEFVELQEDDALRALSDNEVDVVATDHTLDIDVRQAGTPTGLSFSPMIYNGGTTFAGNPQFVSCADRRDFVSDDCEDIEICVVEGTAHDDSVSDKFHDDFVLRTDSIQTAFENLASGSCNVIAADSEDVTISAARRGGYGVNEPYDTGTNRHSKRIIALATREDESLWSRFVFWTVTALAYAEEEGITKADAENMPAIYVFGISFLNMMPNAVGAVGSTKEIYERNIGTELRRGGPNGVNFQLGGPQHYPLPIT